LSKFFPGLPLFTPKSVVQLTGIGKGPASRAFVKLPLEFVTTETNPLHFTAETYVVDGLACGILLGAGFLKENLLDVVWAKTEHELDRLDWKGQTIPISVTKSTSGRTKAQIYVTDALVIPPGHGQNVKVRHRTLTYQVDGYLINPTPQVDIALDTFGSLIHGVVGHEHSRLPYANFGKTSIALQAGQVIGVLEQAPSLPVQTSVFLGLTEIFEGLPPVQEDPEGKYPAGYPHLIQPVDTSLDISQADISKHWGEDNYNKILQVVTSHAHLFRDGLGSFNDGIEMPIPFKEGVDIKDLKQVPYSFSERDKRAFDAITNPLREMGIVEPVPLGKPSPAASPAFMVWKGSTPRVVVDLRRVNTKVNIDAYPLPKQDTILSAMNGAVAFSILDITKSFFQQKICPRDRWKTAFVTPHRGHEQLTVSTMGLASSPSFFQHRMERLFGPYLWKFVLVYIDDIIIFSKDITTHVDDLSTVLDLLLKSGVTLSLAKCHFAQPGLKALGHWVDRLGLSTVHEKVEAIRQMAFPTTLQQLEHGLGFFGYYRKFVPHYGAVVRPLQLLKTLRFKGSPTSKTQRRRFTEKTLLLPALEKVEEEAKKAWHTIKEFLCTAPTLAFPNFDRMFILYVDGSKELGFGVAVHQEDDDGVERPVLYLSKDLSPAEMNFWPTELETGALVWALQKLPQFLDHHKFVVWTDHSAIKGALSLAPVHGKRSLRLANWRLFLSKYINKMEIKHRAGKTHNNADGLSRIAKEGNLAEATLLAPSATRHAGPTHLVTVYPVTTRARQLQLSDNADHGIPAVAEDPSRATPEETTPTVTEDPPLATLPADVPPPDSISDCPGPTMVALHVHPEFLKSIARSLPSDQSFRVLYEKMTRIFNDSKTNEAGPTTTYQNFRRDPKSKLLYLANDGPERLCIPRKHFPKLFSMVHDNRAHVGCNRLYEYLRDIVFFPNMKREILKYTSACPVCKTSLPKRTHPWGALEPIEHPMHPLSTLCIDFIDGLPMSKQGHNKVLTITCKSSKYIKWLLGLDTDSAEGWADKYYRDIYPDWGFPDRIISDRDSKFTSAFWRRLFKLANTQLAFTAAYHSAANGQSERTNQTFNHALRCAIAGKLDQSDWEDFLPDIQLALNTSVNSSTGKTPYSLMYGREAKTELTPDGESNSEWIQGRLDLRREAADAVALAQTRMKMYYDARHIRPKFGSHAYLRIAKSHEKGYHLQNHTKLSPNKIGPLKIVQPHGPLAYEIELPSWLKGVHPVISVEYLEPAPLDPYKRTLPKPGPITVQGEERYIIDKIIGKESRTGPGHRGRKPYYHVQWLDYDETTWELASELSKQVPGVVRSYETSRAR
jgi:hypothetical protein